MNRNTSLHGKGAGALTPDPDRPTRVVKQSAQPAVGSLTAERVLYEALQWERGRNRALTQQIHELEKRWERFRTNRLLYKVGSKLKPNHNDAPKEKE